MSELLSYHYKSQLMHLHNTSSWGKYGHIWAELVEKLLIHNRLHSVLDYGCGKGTFKSQMEVNSRWKGKILEYDPGILGKDKPPEGHVGLLLCVDVLEHIERDCLDTVLKHIASYNSSIIIFKIVTNLSKKCLPDGRNSHLIQEDYDWWNRQLQQYYSNYAINIHNEGKPLGYYHILERL